MKPSNEDFPCHSRYFPPKFSEKRKKSCRNIGLSFKSVQLKHLNRFFLLCNNLQFNMLTKTNFTPNLEALVTAKSVDSNDLIKERVLKCLKYKWEHKI